MSEAELKKLSRREALGMLGAAGAILSSACSGESPTSPTATTALTITTTPAPTTTPPLSGATCVVTPSETAGPFPSITLPVRSDVREDRTGLLLTLAIAVVNTNASCAPAVNASVEIWHCDAAGSYSEYGNVSSSTWLRGVQPVDANGVARFTTIYPGWYAGRATHIHIEVFVNNRSVKTTQIAFPEEINSAVYATGVYASKGQNPTRAANDMVFSDGVTSELASVAGNTTSGYAATFTVGISI
jgi:protocatechuate 3,4-dioxygenase beta subunit